LRTAALLFLISCGLSTGCAALTNPVGDAVPARLVPSELLAPPRLEEQSIPLSLLGQPRPAVYQLAPGDVLGVYVERVLGDRTQPIPLHVAPPLQLRDQRRLNPSEGYPVEVQADGTIPLPLVPPLKVIGLSLPDAAEAIRKHYTDNKLLKPDIDRVLVSLIQARQHQVLVFRQEAANFTVGAGGVVSTAKRGTGHVIDLPAYENDVLHALASTGGLPGLDAYNEVIIHRAAFHDGAERALLQKQMELPQTLPPSLGAQVVRIPLRLQHGQPAPVRPEDVVLQTGDVVFLEARDCEIFYTGGLLPPGSHIIPRDIDLDVVEAIARVGGPLINGAFGGSNLSGALINPGIGNPSPTHLVVVRKTPGGGQVPILVDLRKALRDPRERIRVVAGDLLILQEKPQEALARYFTQTFFNFNLAYQVFHDKFGAGVIDVAAPDRLPGRLETLNLTPR
jgi:protein involved in polysaccharide export with SLBB domain